MGEAYYASLNALNELLGNNEVNSLLSKLASAVNKLSSIKELSGIADYLTVSQDDNSAETALKLMNLQLSINALEQGKSVMPYAAFNRIIEKIY